MTGIQINGYYTKMNFIVFEYTLKPSRGKAFKVVFIVGKGYAVFEYFFRQLNNTLDLFYYRGDGMGDGGSGMIWFKKKRFKPLIEHLTQNGKNGVIITDGSNFSDFKAFKAWQHNSPYADKRKVFTFFSNRTTLYEFTPTKVLRNYLSNGVVKWEVKII